MSYMEEIYCPHCGHRTPSFNFCANCGKPLHQCNESANNSFDSPEFIIAAIKTSDSSRMKDGEPKNVLFTTNYLIEFDGSKDEFIHHIMNMSSGGQIIEDVNKKIDLNTDLKALPNPKVIAYYEIEKAELYSTFLITYLEITSTSFTPRYNLGAKKYRKQFEDKLRNLLEPKIGYKFIMK